MGRGYFVKTIPLNEALGKSARFPVASGPRDQFYLHFPGGPCCHALAYNLANFIQTLALPEAVAFVYDWLRTEGYQGNVG